MLLRNSCALPQRTCTARKANQLPGGTNVVAFSCRPRSSRLVHCNRPSRVGPSSAVVCVSFSAAGMCSCCRCSALADPSCRKRKREGRHPLLLGCSDGKQERQHRAGSPCQSPGATRTHGHDVVGLLACLCVGCGLLFLAWWLRAERYVVEQGLTFVEHPVFVSVRRNVQVEAVTLFMMQRPADSRPRPHGHTRLQRHSPPPLCNR